MKKLLFTLLSFGAATSFVCAQNAGSITAPSKDLRVESQQAATLSQQPDAVNTNSNTVFRKGVVNDWFFPLTFVERSAIGPSLTTTLAFCMADSQLKWVSDDGIGGPHFMSFGHSLDPKDDAIDNTDNPGIKFDKFTRYTLDSIALRYLYVRHVDSIDDGQGGKKPVVDTLFIAYYTGKNQILETNFDGGTRDKVSVIQWNPTRRIPSNFTKMDTILLTPDYANNELDTTSVSQNETSYGSKLAAFKTPDGFPEVAANNLVAFVCVFKGGVETVIGTDTAVMVYQKAPGTLPPGTRRANVFGTVMRQNDKRAGTAWSNPTFFNSHQIMPKWNGYATSGSWVNNYVPGSAFVVDFFNETGFKLSSDNTGIRDIKNDLFALSNIYPNPAVSGEKAVLAFNLKTSSTVKITLVNLVGQEVSTVVNERFTSGEYEANINLNGIKAGVYFVNMTVDGISECKKLTVTE